MGKTVIDRMTVNWQGEGELKTAEKFRSLVGDRKINVTIKQLIQEWLKKAGS